jgi:hypothetical protein
MPMRRRLPLLLFVLLGLTVALPAAQAPAASQAQSAAAAAPAEEWSTTEHTMRLGNQSLPYRAKAGTTAITNLPLQRWPGVGLDVAAHGLGRPEARGDTQ